METARTYEPEPSAEAEARPSPLQLVVLAQEDPAGWFADLWTYIELTGEDVGA
jgi:hypothetical protein